MPEQNGPVKECSSSFSKEREETTRCDGYCKLSRLLFVDDTTDNDRSSETGDSSIVIRPLPGLGWKVLKET